MSSEEFAAHAGYEVMMVVDLYFTDCWWSTMDFTPAAQASHNYPEGYLLICNPAFFTTLTSFRRYIFTNQVLVKLGTIVKRVLGSNQVYYWRFRTNTHININS